MARKLRMTAVLLLVAAVMAAAVTDAMSDHYLLLSLVLALLAMVPMFLRFERKRPNTRELVFVAILAALAAAGRVPFAALPSVQPTSFMIILSGSVLGADAGFMIGAMAALVSNLFLGQGPWTPWQMFGWGLMGLTAGWLGRSRLLGSLGGLAAFGFLWGILFGWIMNLTLAFSFLAERDWASLLSTYAASVWFDLAHAAGNVVFIAALGRPMRKWLLRYRTKYGLGRSDG